MNDDNELGASDNSFTPITLVGGPLDGRQIEIIRPFATPDGYAVTWPEMLEVKGHDSGRCVYALVDGKYQFSHERSGK